MKRIKKVGEIAFNVQCSPPHKHFPSDVRFKALFAIFKKICKPNNKGNEKLMYKFLFPPLPLEHRILFPLLKIYAPAFRSIQ